MKARDGLEARAAGEWARAKLAFIDYFGSAAIDATLKKRDRVYIDLFAGPGVNILEETGEEFEGAALRILQRVGVSHPEKSFTAATLVNIEREDHAVLKERVTSLCRAGRSKVPEAKLDHRLGDANALIPSILSAHHPQAYVPVFADLENPSQWPWSSVEALRDGGHESLDLYLLFPFEMGIRRLLNFQGGPVCTPGNATILDAFFGCDEWRPIAESRVTQTQSRQMARELEGLYLKRLLRHWQYVQRTAVMHLEGQRGLYRMVFASDHEAGKKLARWASARGLVDRDQQSLDLGGL